MPKGSDENRHKKWFSQHGKHLNFSTKKWAANSAFIINDFAEKVEYSIDGFLEKSPDTILEWKKNIAVITIYWTYLTLSKEKISHWA